MIDERLSDKASADGMAPPHHPTAEEAILGSILKQPLAMAGLVALAADEFYLPKNRTIWRAMLDLWRRNVPIDYQTLDARIQDADMKGSGIGIVDLARIDLSSSSVANVEYYAQLVHDAATQRRYIGVAQKLAELAWRSGADIAELTRTAESLLAAARPTRSGRDLYDPERWATTFWDDLSARQNGSRTAVSTGLIDLDTMTLGLEAGALYLLLGISGTGKTELALQLAIHVGAQHGPVLFASLEMRAEELAYRYARICSDMDRNRLAKGTLDDEEQATAVQVMAMIEQSRLWTATPSRRYTTTDLQADAAEVQSKAGHIALIVADYVQRFRDRVTDKSSREENVGLVAENLKSIAREFGCPVLAPVQSNREYVARPNKRPLLSDLRESGKLEQESDVVLGLYRDDKHTDESKEPGVLEVNMLKNRSGVGDTSGWRKLIWRGNKYDNFIASSPAPLPWNEGRSS